MSYPLLKLKNHLLLHHPFLINNQEFQNLHLLLMQAILLLFKINL